MISLSPLGTVRERLGVFSAKTTPFPEWLVHGARGLDLGSELPYYAWELLGFVNGGAPREREALLALVTVSLVVAHEGKTRLRLSSLEQRVAALGGDPDLGTLARDIVLKGELGREILGRPDAPKALIVEDGELIHQRVYLREREVKRVLSERIAAKTDASGYARLLDALDDILARPPLVEGQSRRLSTEQQHAVRTAAGRKLSVITGGPGSGKTTIVASLLRVLVRMGVAPARVALAAPTGKAARLLADAVLGALRTIGDPGDADRALLERCPEPTTLHRLLGRHVHAQALIVDEASMIDLELMARLLSATPRDTRLVFLGDSDQLPPVGPGAVFREILSVSEGAIALGESYRLDSSAAGGRNIRLVANHVRSVSAEPLFHPDSRAEESIAVRHSADEVRFQGVEILESSREEFLARWNRERVQTPEYRDLARRELEPPFGDTGWETLLRLKSLLDAQQILTVTNRDARRVNELLGARGSVKPVIVVRNDRDRGLVNGESGLLVGRRVLFTGAGAGAGTGETFDVFDRESLGAELALSYAITVHKSQGSEYEHVALILPEPDHPLLSRQLLYTALTRAQKSLTLLGKKDAVIAAMARSV